MRVLALAVLVLVTACATGSPVGTAYHDRAPVPRDASETWARQPEADENGVQQEAALLSLPTDFAPVRVSEPELTDALTTLWLDIPLRVTTSRPALSAGCTLTLSFVSLNDEEWQSALAQSYARYCERCGTPGDCLTLFEDGPRFHDDDKRRLALALAVQPSLAGMDAEVRALLNPTRMLSLLSIGIAGYMALLVAPVPEPVTKGIALAFTVLMWGYLGWEFFELMRAYAQLHEEAPHASTFEELREIGDRFGRVLGPNSVRILVMVGTAAVGESMTLASKLPKLPGFRQAPSQWAPGMEIFQWLQAGHGPSG